MEWPSSMPWSSPMSKHACPGDGYESVLCDVRLVAVSRISKLSAKPAWLSTQTLDADTSSGWRPIAQPRRGGPQQLPPPSPGRGGGARCRGSESEASACSVRSCWRACLEPTA
ncbi:unnamed protein product [Prorocentrum cordatum]|uniref:Uncharacterized protein n=1 Tax=Prorocentrum cordatum TaxID=2364126 RepID=A0ABN9T9S0_9DINO|nr:unnamed protein product [Polarella glacialis]